MQANFAHGLAIAWLFIGSAVPQVANAQLGIVITGTHGNSEGACAQATKALGGLDCTFDGTNVVGTPNGWSGPSLGGAYYAAGAAGDSILYAPAPADGKTSPAISGTLILTEDGEEAVLSGVIVIGAGVRNIATGESDRAVQRWTSITHTLNSTPVNSAAANANGGFDYVIGSLGAPDDICLSPAGACFGVHESGANPATGPAGSWGVSGVSGVKPDVGITALENLAGASATGGDDRRNFGATTTAVIDGDSCDSTDIDDCITGETLWGRGENPGFDNLILVFSTNSAGDITSGTAYWSQDYRQAVGSAPAGDNSTLMGTFTFTGTVALPACGNFFASVIEDSSSNAISTTVHCINFSEALEISIDGGPNHGTATVDGANNIIYTPTPGFTGTDSITFSGADGTSEDGGLLTLTVEADIAPVAPDGTINISTRGLAPETVAGALDVSGLPGYAGGNAPTSISIGAPASGTVALSGTNVLYTPNSGFYAGTDTFTYSVADFFGDVVQGTLTVTIPDVAPTVADASILTGRDTASAPLALGVAAGNGSAAQHTLSVVADGLHGSCTLTADDATGQVIYTPDGGFTGSDSCEIRLADADGDQDSSTISVTVNAEPVTPPAITSGPAPDGTVGQAYSFAYGATGTAPITYSVGSGSLPPGLTLSAAGLISGTPTSAGTYSGTVVASNGAPPDASQAFSLVIGNRNSGGGGGGALDGPSLLTLLLVGLAARRRRLA